MDWEITLVACRVATTAALAGRASTYTAAGGIDTSVDAARKSACATNLALLADVGDIRVLHVFVKGGDVGSDEAVELCLERGDVFG